MYFFEIKIIKLNFKKDEFDFESLSIKIDRETHTVKETEPLFIFRNIDANTYRKLIPLAEEDYAVNLWSKFAFTRQTKKICSKRAFFKAKMKRFKFSERFGILKVIIRKPFKGWKKAPKELVNYITNIK